MKRVELSAYGVPQDVAHCVDGPRVGEPAANEIVFDVLAFPINPADIGFCTGHYRLRPSLPAVPGAECAGRVVAIGRDVTHLSPSDLVICLERENWAQQRRVPADRVVVLPPELDICQAAMLRINPPTAQLMLSDIVTLAPGDWVIQNAANSAVGKLVVLIAKARGIRSINVVRSQPALDEVLALGGDICLLDGPELADKVKEATLGAAVPIGFDAVAGAATGRIAQCLSDGGTVCTYGAMSGLNPEVPIAEVIFRDIKLVGFLLLRSLARRSETEINDLYRDLAHKVIAGTLHGAVDKIFQIEEIQVALTMAQEKHRTGKILVSPNGQFPGWR